MFVFFSEVPYQLLSVPWSCAPLPQLQVPDWPPLEIGRSRTLTCCRVPKQWVTRLKEAAPGA